jgi:hypothetical protein
MDMLIARNAAGELNAELTSRGLPRLDSSAMGTPAARHRPTAGRRGGTGAELTDGPVSIRAVAAHRNYYSTQVKRSLAVPLLT